MSARAVLVGLVAVIAVVAFARTANTKSPPSRIVPSPLSQPLAIVPGAAPDAGHPVGTALIFGGEATSNDLVAVEWDISSARELGRVTVERDTQVSCATAQRAGDTIYLATGCSSVVLFTLDVSKGSPRVTDRLMLGESMFTTSLAVDERWVLVGAYESGAPLVPPKNLDGFAPSEVLHVRAIERASGQIKGARVFHGDQLLSTNARPPGALALVNGAAMLALPMGNKVRVVRAELPSLAPSRTTDLAVPGAWDAVGVLAAIDGQLLVSTEKEWVLFGPKLEVVRRRDAHRSLSRVVVEPKTSRILADGELSAMPIAATATIDVASMTWAWERAIAVGQTSNSDPVVEVLAR